MSDAIPKQIIVIRKDLNMRKGKMVAQGAHASTSIVIEMEREWDADYGWSQHSQGKVYEQWSNDKFTKICVSVSSEEELLAVHEQAKKAGLLCSLIKDAGLTEFKEPTYTAVAIGPAMPEDVDPITGKLPLL